jgi:hypothetical protein
VSSEHVMDAMATILQAISALGSRAIPNGLRQPHMQLRGVLSTCTEWY